MLFNFDLFPFSELISELEQPEGERSNAPYWYRLSDGWYWIDVGETHLFRYTPACRDVWQPLRRASGLYVDYFLSTFFRDLLEHLPAMLEPIPAPLAERLSSMREWNDWIAERHKCRKEEEEEEEEDCDLDDEVEKEGEFYNYGVNWWYERNIGVGYLNAGPHIWIWNDSTNIHVGWDNRGCLINGLPVWEAQMGQIALPIADFLNELLAFDHQLMGEMAERIVAARDYWADPRFVDNLLFLQQEQQDYAAMLGDTLSNATSRLPTDWLRVLSSIAAYPPSSKRS
jgi:hypothetical protein